MMGGSDGIYAGGRPHPRGCGCFARYLGHYVREGVWTLETAVQRLAAHAARRFGLSDRGLLRAGMAADVVVFDPDDDRATARRSRTASSWRWASNTSWSTASWCCTRAGARRRGRAAACAAAEAVRRALSPSRRSRRTTARPNGFRDRRLAG